MNTSHIAVTSIPTDHNSSYRRGTAHGPARIREALYCDSANMWTEKGHDLSSEQRWSLLPETNFGDTGTDNIEEHLAGLLDSYDCVITLGGDHSITHPIIRAYASRYPDLSILHLDAHPDLYDELDGNRASHACPFARIKEEFPSIRLVQGGIRTATGHQREQAERFGVEMIEMMDIGRLRSLEFAGPVYLSLDLDCLDPAFAPGVAHYEPGGMSTREVITTIQDLDGRLVGGDLVEYNPERDVNNMTAMVAAKLLKEMIGRMLDDTILKPI